MFRNKNCATYFKNISPIHPFQLDHHFKWQILNFIWIFTHSPIQTILFKVSCTKFQTRKCYKKMREIKEKNVDLTS